MEEIKQPSAVSIEVLVQKTFQVMKELESLLEDESAALIAANFKQADSFQDKKKELSQDYNSCIRNLINRKEDVAALPASMKELIVKTRLHFSKVLSANMRAIDGVRKSSQRLVDKIIDSARETVSTDAGYNAAGRIYSSSSVAGSPVSISINETL